MRRILYSNGIASRITRHALFWLILFVLEYSISVIFIYPRYLLQGDIKVLFVSWDLNTANFLVDILYCYLIIYFLYPRFRLDMNTSRFIFRAILFLIPAFIVKCLIGYALDDTYTNNPISYLSEIWLVFIAFLN